MNKLELIVIKDIVCSVGYLHVLVRSDMRLASVGPTNLLSKDLSVVTDHRLDACFVEHLWDKLLNTITQHSPRISFLSLSPSKPALQSKNKELIKNKMIKLVDESEKELIKNKMIKLVDIYYLATKHPKEVN